MYRLFAAIDVPTEIADVLQSISKKVTGASWRPVENYHITLRFFGDLDGGSARDLDHELGEIDAGQMQLYIKGTGWFGASDPHALWAGLAPDDNLKALASKCERAARRIGLPKEKRPFRPHVTLAYCHGTPLAEAMAFCQRHALLDVGPFWVDRFYLCSSWSGKGPSRYIQEAEYPLGPIRSFQNLPDGN